MIRAVSTRWNTTAELISCAKDLRLALNLLVNMEQHNKSCGVRLKRFQLSTQEWDLLLQLYPLLDVSRHWVIRVISIVAWHFPWHNRYSLRRRRRCRKVKHLFFMRSFRSSISSQVTSTNSLTILTTSLRYELLLDKATPWWTNIMGLPTTQLCIVLLCVGGLSLSVKSTNWFFWIVLHPHFKSLYFVKAKWPRDWITTAEGILRDEWTKNYKASVEPDPTESTVCCCFALQFVVSWTDHRRIPQATTMLRP